jgi:hypothetical protein
MSMRVLLVVYTLLLGSLIPRGAAWAQPETYDFLATRPVVQEGLTTTPVTVESIDEKNRAVIVKTADGEKIALTVPHEVQVQVFEQLDRGDEIDIDYYPAVAVNVVPAAGSESPHPKDEAMGDQVISARVVSSDAKTMTVEDRRGETQTVSVKAPLVQTQMKRVKPGDNVEITLTEAVLVGIHPSREPSR